MNTTILLAIIGVLSSTIGFLLGGWMKNVNSKIEKVEIENKEIVNNYKARFEKVHAKMNDMEKNIIREINKIKS